MVRDTATRLRQEAKEIAAPGCLLMKLAADEIDTLRARLDTARLASVASLIRGILTSVKGAEHFTDKTADVRTWSTEDVHEFLGALKYEIGVAFKTIKDIEARAAIGKEKQRQELLTEKEQL